VVKVKILKSPKNFARGFAKQDAAKSGGIGVVSGWPGPGKKVIPYPKLAGQ
jgi:hypothetical protein